MYFTKRATDKNLPELPPKKKREGIQKRYDLLKRGELFKVRTKNGEIIDTLIEESRQVTLKRLLEVLVELRYLKKERSNTFKKRRYLNEEGFLGIIEKHILKSSTKTTAVLKKPIKPDAPKKEATKENVQESLVTYLNRTAFENPDQEAIRRFAERIEKFSRVVLFFFSARDIILVTVVKFGDEIEDKHLQVAVKNWAEEHLDEFLAV